MHGPDAIAELFRQVRGYTITFLERAPDESLFWSPPGLVNHILWRSGHAAWAIDLIAAVPLGGRSTLPAGWSGLFGEGGTPPNETTDWPSRTEVLSVLRTQRDQLLTLLSQVDPERLSGPAQGFSDAHSLGGWVLHAIHDEALHQGETYLALKMLAAAE